MDDVREVFKDKTLLPGQGHDWRAHNTAVLTLVVYGRLEEGFAEGRQACTSWQLHYKPRGAVHTTSTGSRGVRMLMLRLSGSALAGLGVDSSAGPRVLSGGVSSARALRAFLEIQSRCHSEAGVGLGDAADLCRELLAADAGSGQAAQMIRRPAWIREVHRQVRTESAERRRLSDLAHEFQVHPVYLARAFRKHYGSSISATRRRSRIDRAVGRLVKTPLALSELALELGYADQSHFTREFKRETGWTPNHFRRTAAALAKLAP